MHIPIHTTVLNSARISRSNMSLTLLRSFSNPRMWRSIARRLSTLRLNPTILQLPPSGIREIMAAAIKMEVGTIETSSSSSVIHLEVGQPNFATPDNIINASVEALKAGKTAYCPNAGISELRKAVAQKYNSQNSHAACGAENIMITTGSMLSLYSLYLTLFKPGDECLIPFPGFPNYQQGLSMVHAKPVPYPCHAKNNYLPNLADVEAMIGPRTKAILICNPGNPTGASYSMGLMENMMKLAEKYDLFVISDEIYAEVVFDAPHASACLFQRGDVNNSKLAVISGVSKSYAMTGFRVGWTRTSAEIVENMSKLMEPVVSCGVPFAQWAAIEALEGTQQPVQEMIQQYKERRDKALVTLKERGREQKYSPGGAFYLPLDISSITGPVASSKTGIKTSKEFAFKLLGKWISLFFYLFPFLIDFLL